MMQQETNMQQGMVPNFECIMCFSVISMSGRDRVQGRHLICSIYNLSSV